MDKKAVKGILFGYDSDDGYRIWDNENFKPVRSRNVVFHEELLVQETKFDVPFGPSADESTATETQSEEETH